MAMRWLLIAGFCVHTALAQHSVVSEKGVVVSVDEWASRAGVDILRQGGNAVDAAVATALVLAVTYPQAGNIGGGGYFVIRLADGRSTTIDFRETAPAKSDARMFLRSDGSLDTFHVDYGYRVAGIPGMLRGLEMAWKKYGKLKWKDLVLPAADLAERGFALPAVVSNTLQEEKSVLRLFPETRAIFFRDNEPLRAGDMLVQKDLARILRLVADSGAAVFYEGSPAVHMVREMQNHGGLWSVEDLRNYQAMERAPIRSTYRGYEVIGMPPSSSGGITLALMLNVLENAEIRRQGAAASPSLHRMIETMRHAFMDRQRHLADPGFTAIPTETLLSKEYARQMFRSIHPDRIASSDSLHLIEESSETTHFSVIDREGNVVSATVTIEDNFGSHALMPGMGFFLNSEMHDFNVRPDVPNAQGGFGGNPNRIEPGKRMLSSMTPTIVVKDGKPFLVVGSPGGRTIINTVLQVLIGVIDEGLTLRQAIDAPRLSHNWLPNELRFERDRWSEAILADWRRRGHRLKDVGFIGDAHCIWIDPKTRMYHGEADTRRNGFAAGY